MFSSPRYSLPARLVHWAVALCVLALYPLGLWATSRAEADIWDDLTNTLYAWHKTIGFGVLILMVLRLVIRGRRSPPAYPSNLATWEISAAKGTHHVIYLLLLIVPLLGWAGATAFPALDIFAGMHLPAMPFMPTSGPLGESLLNWHGTVAFVLGAILIVHVAAALRHLVIKRDGVVDRMWFGSN